MERDFHILKVAVNEQLKKMEEKFENLFVVNVDNYNFWIVFQQKTILFLENEGSMTAIAASTSLRT